MNFDKIRQVAAAQHKDEAIRAQRVIKLFLAGPYIRTDKPLDDPANSKTPSHIVRYYLNQTLVGPNVTVYLGEDKELRETGEKHYGLLSNAVVYERHHIQNHLDGVIILPSSPGSFCEIGDWAASVETCKKMVVIVDKPHENLANYINDGVLKLAILNGAKVHYLEYDKKESIKDLCSLFIEEIRAKLEIEKLYGRI